ncbi:PTS system, hyaluronate-oligosaccharide-specific IIA component [Liquorilactobacillus sucicola DSM 21376 = JCM 15457]|uniref:N-acetylglucosamine galactosamine PTS, EIIA n=1 Tax=Liquorilactobacillus sucicola DSM 21376 = JCM 15457 TaxID=1423806 RepID=A0A023CXH4_9LACO|nr:multidrug transporter [Liquorilactobacillus sucicola]KRN07032.1 N-acetylglucosamine galactosamine PTS, EIIA [Liquorilactobacillus sucicola DSM 21376 = JCM 15457]GAJ26524.1 PTS system, hyaluronate-oligosaccharide-specific IIA component [Liquorilactobacillus sucicola DSM 21376 = JCM 15457]
MQIIVTGHGQFGTGIESTVKLLAGSIKNVKYIDFTSEMNEDDLAERFASILKKDFHAVFFCDLVGGTPYKQAVLKKDKYDIAVVGGCNVGSLLEIGLQTDLTIATDVHEIAHKLIAATKVGAREFGTYQTQNTASGEDGI